MQLLSALDQMVGLLWISLLVSGTLVACGIALHGTGALVARLFRNVPKQRSFREWLRQLGKALLYLPSWFLACS